MIIPLSKAVLCANPENDIRFQVRALNWWKQRVSGIGGDGCWVWMKGKSSAGYGIASRQRYCEYYAHRLSYRIFRGTIPEGLQIDHLCRNRACVRPSHLEAVEQRVNLARGNSLSAQLARRTHCNYGHEFTPENTYKVSSRPGIRVCKACIQIRDKKKRGRISA